VRSVTVSNEISSNQSSKRLDLHGKVGNKPISFRDTLEPTKPSPSRRSGKICLLVLYYISIDFLNGSLSANAPGRQRHLKLPGGSQFIDDPDQSLPNPSISERHSTVESSLESSKVQDNSIEVLVEDQVLQPELDVDEDEEDLGLPITELAIQPIGGDGSTVQLMVSSKENGATSIIRVESSSTKEKHRVHAKREATKSVKPPKSMQYSNAKIDQKTAKIDFSSMDAIDDLRRSQMLFMVRSIS
jgi:hypothetical protein